ncbi:hypothetical protein LJ737_14590 [Hymenobacter sp. 15J16-1T3B]|uniref:hypothetical protein n=1 Tax=Hymenobacter sp. 15J16-1T3B TaxID=2886941 RepID=UPI001D0FE39C|nr:hypothetical protein [Hymenobacter sp. 15J16-1T3B]MCC3158475.1 hypothetical protein [Hymenobacter sp. 15J16-1T3B]
MRAYLLLFLVLAAAACQRGPDEATQRQLAQLRQQVARQSDTLDRLHQELRRAAAAANHPCPADSAAARPRLRELPSGTLYGTPAAVELPDAELAEVLSVADTSVYAQADDCAVRAYLLCNGPGDATLDYCTCSHYVYLALTGGDAVEEYKLFRVGPFFEAKLVGWENNDAKSSPLTLRIRHNQKGRPKTDAFRVSWRGVRRL